jgi:hypothetical protein
MITPPYRHPRRFKDEIEKTIKQLLAMRHVIAQFLLVQKGKANGGKIGVTGGCPITVTLIRHIFLFRDEAQGRRSR